MRIHFFILLFCSIWACQIGNGQPLFSNVSEDLGVTFKHEVESGFGHGFDTGAAWFDVDADGDLDLFVTQRNGANRLYRNNLIGLEEMSFTNIAIGDVLDERHFGSGVSVADYDNDGDLDIYLANANEDVLLQNTGEGDFLDVTNIAFPGFPAFISGRGCTATWGDVNGDGWLDLYVSNHIINGANSLDYFFINNGGYPVTFTNETSIFSKDFDNDSYDDNRGFSFVSAMTDYDNDGDLDIYVTNDCPWGSEDNKLWRNEGGLNFIEVSREVGPFIGGSATNGVDLIISDCQNAMGIAIGDPNRDGLFDMFYTNWNTGNEPAVFLYNDGKNLFNKSVETGLDDIVVPETNKVRVTWGTVFIDYDLDMLQDLAVASGSLHTLDNATDIQPNLLYHNIGIESNLPQFVRIEDNISGIADIHKGRTLVMGDYDMDGDPDLFLVNFDGESMLFQNNNDNQNNWLIVELDGAGAPYSNRNGIGAKIKATTGDGISQHWEMRSGSSLGGGDDIAAYFGLAENNTVDLEIKWPSGIVQIEEDVSINQRIKIAEKAMRVISPVLADTAYIGETMEIVWKNELGGEVDVLLFDDKGQFTTIAEDYEQNSISWQVPWSFTTSNTCYIIVENSSDSELYARSYGYFVIDDSRITSIENELKVANELNISVFPNPIVTENTLNYTVPEASGINISIYDLCGKRLTTLVDSRMELRGEHVIEWNSDGLHSGIYIIKLQSDKKSTSLRVLKK